MQAIQLVLPIFGAPDNTPATDDAQRRPKKPHRPNRSEPRASVSGDGVERQTLCDGNAVSYLFRRRRRKSIGFTIDQRGLIVSAPRWVPFSEVEDAVREKAGWIARKTLEWEAFEMRRASLDTVWEDGGELKYLGETVRLSLNPQLSSTQLGNTGPSRVLSVPLAPGSPPENVKRLAERWLRDQAHVLLSERIEYYAGQMGVGPREWALSNARTQWGSCSADRIIRLNWRLINLPMDLLDYVVVHELAHLRELNHSAAFWRVVESAMPDYKQARETLNSMPEHLAL